MRLFRVTLFILCTISSVLGSSQIPLSNIPSYLSGKDHLSDEEGRARDATDNLVFSTVASLLQQWPNTLYRNGHTIARGEIPAGTVLYHERNDSSIPTVPDWLATDVEHSYLLATTPECWMLSFMVEQPLQVIYFDGSSAANTLLGHHDSQDLVIWGKVRPDKILAEYERIEELCKWVEPFGLDGIIRMEMGFEVMLCDFSKKVKLVSSLRIMGYDLRSPSVRSADSLEIFKHRQMARHTGQSDPNFSLFGPSFTHFDTAPIKSEPPLPTTTFVPPCGGEGQFPCESPGKRIPQPRPPGWSGPLLDMGVVHLEGIQAAAWNSYYPGEMRVKLDYTRLVSFYSPKLQSLVKARENVPRWKHRLTEISKDDLETSMQWLKEDLSRDGGGESGIDWGTLTRTVMDRYKDRLWLLHQSLSLPLTPSIATLNTTERASLAREQVMIMLTPYLIFGAVPTSSDAGNTSWVEPIRTQCSTQLMSLIPENKLERSERMIKSATEGVLEKICTTLTTIWIDALGVFSLTEAKQGEFLDRWRTDMEGLITWLDWPVWHTCRPACGETEFCYQPTWPWGVPWQAPPDGSEIDMTPKCIDRLRGKLGGPEWLRTKTRGFVTK